MDNERISMSVPFDLENKDPEEDQKLIDHNEEIENIMMSQDYLNSDGHDSSDDW